MCLLLVVMGMLRCKRGGLLSFIFLGLLSSLVSAMIEMNSLLYNTNSHDPFPLRYA
jgi:hypothetical protein